jgi:hypothetical protein
MTISPPRSESDAKRQELDERTRQAWSTYQDSLRELSGPEYDDAESRSWERLQRKLRQVDRERAALTESSTRRGDVH